MSAGSTAVVAAAMAGLSILVVLFWVWKIWLPRHKFQDFEAGEGAGSGCSSREGQYSAAYLRFFDNTGGCKEADAMLNSLILAATLVALYWMIQHAKHDWGLHRYGMGIQFKIPGGNSKWFSATAYAVLMAAVVANTLVVLPWSAGAAAVVYLALLGAWLRFKDAGRYPNMRKAGREEAGGVGGKAYVRALPLQEKLEKYARLRNATTEFKGMVTGTGKSATTDGIQMREAMLLRHELLTAPPCRQPMWAARQAQLSKASGFSQFLKRIEFTWGAKFFNVTLPSAINPRLFLGWVLLVCSLAFAIHRRTVVAGVLGGMLAVGSLCLLRNTYAYRHALKASMRQDFKDEWTWRGGRRLYYKATATSSLKNTEMHTYSTYMKAQRRGATQKPEPAPPPQDIPTEVLVPVAELDALVDPSGYINDASKDTLQNLVAETPTLEGKSWMWRWVVLDKLNEIGGKFDPDVQRAYHHVSWEWWNGAWVNFWRLFLVSSTFHFVAILLTDSSVKAAPTYCGKEKVTGVPDQCAFYAMLERYNLMCSLVLTLLLFSVFMAGGAMRNKVGEYCREIIGTEEVKAEGEWWQIMSDGSVIRALLLYIAVFAFVAHGGAVGYVQMRQMVNLRNSAVHQSYMDNPDFKANMSQEDKEKVQKNEGRRSIVKYAMENDIASNIIMILLLSFLVPYVDAHIWRHPLAASG